MHKWSSYKRRGTNARLLQVELNAILHQHTLTLQRYVYWGRRFRGNLCRYGLRLLGTVRSRITHSHSKSGAWQIYLVTEVLVALKVTLLPECVASCWHYEQSDIIVSSAKVRVYIYGVDVRSRVRFTLTAEKGNAESPMHSPWPLQCGYYTPLGQKSAAAWAGIQCLHCQQTAPFLFLPLSGLGIWPAPINTIQIGIPGLRSVESGQMWDLLSVSRFLVRTAGCPVVSGLRRWNMEPRPSM